MKIALAPLAATSELCFAMRECIREVASPEFKNVHALKDLAEFGCSSTVTGQCQPDGVYRDDALKSTPYHQQTSEMSSAQAARPMPAATPMPAASAICSEWA